MDPVTANSPGYLSLEHQVFLTVSLHVYQNTAKVHLQ